MTTPVQEEGKVQFEYDQTFCTKSKVMQVNILILLSWHGRFYMNTFNAYNFLPLYVYL